jgi:hypothetical protein
MIDISDLYDNKGKALILYYLYKFAKLNAHKKQKAHYIALAGNALTSKKRKLKKAQAIIDSGQLYIYETRLGLDKRGVFANLSRLSFDPSPYNQLHGPHRAETAVMAARTHRAREKTIENIMEAFTPLGDTKKIVLRNDAEVLETTYNKTMATLDKLCDRKQDINGFNLVFFREIVGKCKNSEYESIYYIRSLIEHSDGILNNEGQVASEDIRQTILAATEGNGPYVHRVDPLTSRSAKRKQHQ